MYCIANSLCVCVCEVHFTTQELTRHLCLQLNPDAKQNKDDFYIYLHTYLNHTAWVLMQHRNLTNLRI